jgi:hypothetical protein
MASMVMAEWSACPAFGLSWSARLDRRNADVGTVEPSRSDPFGLLVYRTLTV